MITILTPTYNRAYILDNAYQSLRRQTISDFEWIIVDDGSKDNTEELVSSWQNDVNGFSIYYYKRENGGKHRAVNFGVSRANGDWILILDSDDFLTDDAIEFITNHVQELPNEKFAGIAGLKGWINKEGTIGGQADDDGYIDATNIERVKYHLQGDKAEVYKTCIMRQYPFPEFPNERFLRESASWDRIALDGYKVRWYNHTIYKANYLDDGLTKNNNDQTYIDNFCGFVYCTKLSLKYAGFPYNYIKIGHFVSIARKKQMDYKKMAQILNVRFIDVILGKSIYALRSELKG